MNKNLLLTFLFLVIAGVTVNANTVIDSAKTTFNPDTSYLQKNFISLNLILPGISFERKIGKNSTLYTATGITGTFIKNDIRTGGERIVTTQTFVNPFIEINYRNYYNFEKRIEKDKNIKHNSANYFGVLGSYIFSPINDKNGAVKNSLNLGPVWGFQRVYESGFYLDLNMGLGYNRANASLNTLAFDMSGNPTYYQEPGNYSGINLIGMFHLGFYIGEK